MKIQIKLIKNAKVGPVNHSKTTLNPLVNASDTKSFNIFHFAVAHLNLGMTHSSLGQKEKALAILKGIENIDDDGLKDPKTHLRTQVTALHNCGRLLLELGRPLEAVTVLRKAENRAKAVNYQAQGILNVLGESFQALNKTSEAEISFKKASYNTVFY